jgi:chitinase
MAFLTQGSGPRNGAYSGQLSPWPGTNPPVRNACAVVAADPIVTSGSLVTLDGSKSVAANVPSGAATYKWTQVSGAPVTLANATAAKTTFTAPTVAIGGSNLALVFKLTATPSNGAPAVDSRFVTVTVTPPPDTTAPTVAAPSAVQGTSTNLKRGVVTTLSAAASDNVAVTSVTFTYSYTVNGVKNSGSVPATKGSGTTWSGTFTPLSSVPSGTSYTFTALARDAAGNSTTSSATTKAIQ